MQRRTFYDGSMIMGLDSLYNPPLNCTKNDRICMIPDCVQYGQIVAEPHVHCISSVTAPSVDNGSAILIQYNDPVNHPKHYTSHPSGVECIDIVEHYPMNVGNAMKYLWRAGLKDDVEDIQDLKKAQWYITREIEKREKEIGL